MCKVKLITGFIILVICASIQTIFAQDVTKNLNPEESMLRYQLGNDVSFPNQVTEQQNQEKMDQIKNLSSQLSNAKENGNIPLMRTLESQINSILGVEKAPVDQGPQPNQVYGSGLETGDLDAIGITRIESGAYWSTATATQTNGRIYVAMTKYAAPPASDTLRIYYSDDGGISYTYFAGFEYAADLDFRTDDLDIEVLNDGTNWWIYVTGSYNFNGEAYGFVTRYKEDGTNFFYLNLPKSAGTNQYWTRVVSDYPNFTSAAYIYMVATMDSNITGPTHHVLTRAFVIQDPYVATPTVINRNNSLNGTAYWWQTTFGDTSILRSDIAYMDSLTAGDRIITCSLFENSSIGSSMYFTYSNNYMATPPSNNPNISLTYQSFRPVMAFNGGSNQINGLITTIRKFVDGSDWDPRYIVTGNGGATWTQGYLSSSTDTTYKVDVIGMKGLNGKFKMAWIDRNDPNPEFFYSSGYYTGSFAFTTPVNMLGAGIGTNVSWGGRAGYRLTGTDSCFAVFEGPSGANVYGASGCSGSTTNIQNTELPGTYSLSQNYPNPFNPSTSFRFEIPRDGLVKVVVYDILGKEIATLVNDKKAAGSYIIDFNAAGLSSGVYFYKLIVNEFTDIKKMTLIK